MDVQFTGDVRSLLWFLLGAAGIALTVALNRLQERVEQNYRRPLLLVPLGVGQAAAGIAVVVGTFPGADWYSRIGFTLIFGFIAASGLQNVLRGIANARLAPLMTRNTPPSSLREPGRSVAAARVPAGVAPPPFAPRVVLARDIGEADTAPAARSWAEGIEGFLKAMTGEREFSAWLGVPEDDAQRVTRSVLFLWVFQADPNQSLLLLAGGVGSVYHLCGGGALASGHLLTAVFGTRRDQVEQTPEEVLARLRHFETEHADRSFPVHTMLYNDATWTFALDRLVERTTAVLMDLTGFTSEHMGCEYELGLLVDRVDLGRVVLVTGPATDDALDRTLRAAWATMADDSPNRRADAGPLMIVKVNVSEPAASGADPLTDDERKLRELADYRADFRGIRLLLEQAADRTTVPAVSPQGSCAP